MTLLVQPADIGAAPLTVTLTAQGNDPDGDALTYFWSIVGEGAELESFEGKAVQERTFETPGEYLIEVIARDREFDSEPASVTIVVLDPNAPEG